MNSAIGEKSIRAEESDGNSQEFYNLGIDVEKVSQNVGYAVDTVKEWLGLSDNTK